MNKIFTLLRIITVCCLLNTQAVVGYAANCDVTVDSLGVCIKGNIGVFGDDTLGLFGNVYLNNVKQVGDGVIALTDTLPQILASNNSQINNLLINNPTRVTLVGEVAVVNNLTIKDGTFNTLNGTLLLLPNTTFLIENGTLIKGVSFPASSDSKVTFAFQHLLLENHNLSLTNHNKNLELPIFTKFTFFHSDYFNSFSPPPEFSNLNDHKV